MRESKKNSKTNFSKLDAHSIQPHEYEDLPEWTDQMFDAAQLSISGKPVRRGRPKGEKKIHLGLRLDKEIVAEFRSMGKGWQTQLNNALAEWLREHRT